MLDQSEIVLGRPQEDGHLIERHAALCLLEHATDDFDRFAAFPRRREQSHVSGPLAFRRPLEREHMTSQVGKIARRIGGVRPVLAHAAKGRKHTRRHLVAVRHCREHLRRSAGNSGNEIALGRRIERHIQQDHGVAGRLHMTRRDPRGSEPEQGRPIVDGGAAVFDFNPREQAAHIGRRGALPKEPVAINAGESKLVDRSRQRLREAGHRRHRAEVLELAGCHRVEDGPRGNRLGARLSRRRGTLPGPMHRRRSRGELGETEPTDAERGRRTERQLAREIVRGAPGGGNDNGFRGGRKLREKLPRRIEPGGS